MDVADTWYLLWVKGTEEEARQAAFSRNIDAQFKRRHLSAYSLLRAGSRDLEKILAWSAELTSEPLDVGALVLVMKREG